jgi:hypothetical protein
MAKDKVYLLNYDLQDVTVYNFGEYHSDVVACKGGYGEQGANISFALDNEILIRYNNTNKTQYKLLPSDCYEIPTMEFKMNPDDIRSVMKIKYFTEKIKALPERDNYVIPIQMNVSEGIEVDQDKLTILVRPVFREPYIFVQNSASVQEIPIKASGDTTTHSLMVSLNFPNLSDPYAWDITYKFSVEQSLLDTYNQQNGTNYKLLPAEAYSLNESEWNIPKKKNMKTIPVHFYKKKLVDASNAYLFDDYFLPLKLSQVSHWGIDPDQNIQLIHIPFYPAAFDATNWIVLDWNSDITMDAEYESLGMVPYKMLTGEGWRSKWAPPAQFPYYFIFDMRTSKTVTGIRFTFPDESWRGRLKKGYFEVSSDNENWTRILDWTRPSNTPRVNEYDVDPADRLEGRYLKFVITEATEYFNGDANQGAQLDIQRLEIIGFE